MDMTRADLNLLRSLAVLIEEGNVTRAAARLGVSQPALSAQLARLRDMFGDPLLVPSETGRGMVPTPRALDLRGPLDGMLADVGRILAPAAGFDPTTAERNFTIAASDNGTVVLGMSLFEDLTRRGIGGIHLAFRPLDRTRLRDQVEAGEVDLVLTLMDDVPPGLKTRAVLVDRQVVIQRKGHPRGTGQLDLRQYCAYKHVIMSTEGRWRTTLDDHIGELGHTREVALSVPQFMLAVLAVAGSDLLAMIPARLAEHFTDRVDVFDIPFKPAGFALQAAWHPRNHADPAHIWLRETVAGLVARG